MKGYTYDGSKEFSYLKFDTTDTGGLKKEEAIELMNKNLPEIDVLQKKFYAEKKMGLIFLFQAMDAAGKDGTIQAVLSCLSPHGVRECAFKAPNSTELSHDFLWRIHHCVPERGQIAIFNRSHYEDVLISKVHKLYKNQPKASYIKDSEIIDTRYEDIRNFEKYLYNNSIRVVKIFLNVSKKEQTKRFLARIDQKEKNWKFSSADMSEREFFEEYQKAFKDAINNTATKYCPWYVVPADHNLYMRYVVSQIILDTLRDIDPEYPEIDDETAKQLKGYKKILKEELEK